MDKKDNKSGTFEVGEYILKRVELGLDENQVASIINQLLSQRDTLLKRQEHLLALSQLAERTVAEADELATKFKEEAKEQAEAEAKAILTKAEEQAQQTIELKVAEAMASVQEEAANIRADAEKHTGAMLKERAQRLQSQIRDMARRLCQEMSTQAESFRQQIEAFEANFEQELLELERFSYQEIPKQDEHVTETKSAEATKEEPPLSKSVPETEGEEEHVTLEILPPRDLGEIGKIKTYLESLPAVKMTELLNFTDKTIIEVFLAEGTNLTEKLHELPQVEYAEEVVDGDRKKIQVRLSLVSPLDVTKAKLGKTVSRILSNKP
jgi:hypothetical protein